MDFKTFRQRFKELTHVDRSLLKLLTLYYTPATPPQILKVVNQASLRSETGKKFIALELETKLRKLKQEGFIDTFGYKQYAVAEELMEFVMREAAVDPEFDRLVGAVRFHLPYARWSSPGSYESLLRDFRIAAYRGEMGQINRVLSGIYESYSEEWEDDYFLVRMFTPFSQKWLSTFSVDFQAMVYRQFLNFRTVFKSEDTQEIIDAIRANSELLASPSEQALDLRTSLLLHYFERGDLRSMAELRQQERNSNGALLFEALYSVATGDWEVAISRFETTLKNLRKSNRSRTLLLSGKPGFLHGLLLLARKPRGWLKLFQAYTDAIKTSLSTDQLDILNAIYLYRENRDLEARSNMPGRVETAFDFVLWCLAMHWNQQPFSQGEEQKMLEAAEAAAESGKFWNLLQLQSVLAENHSDPVLRTEAQEYLEKQIEDSSLQPLLPLLPIVEKWQMALEALMSLGGTENGKNRPVVESESRLIWLVDFRSEEIQPKEQKITKSGSWSKGRNIALKRLATQPLEFATDHDRRIIATLQQGGGGWYGYNTPEYYFDFEATMKEMVGHPFVFLSDNQNVSVEVVAENPELIVEKSGDDYVLRMSHASQEPGITIERETPTRYKVVEIEESHQRISGLLNHRSLRIPKRGKEELLKTIGGLSSTITIHSEVGGTATDVPQVDSNDKIVVHLLPLGDGFKIEFFAKPFLTEPPYFKPGVGRERVIAEVDGQPAQTRRDLAREKENADRIEEQCPTLARNSSLNYEWTFEETEECLEVLLELNPLREAEEILMEYPKGEKLKLMGTIDLGGMDVRVNKNGDWFGMEGEVQVNEHMVMNFRDLMALTRDNNKSRFVQLGDGQFIALTNQLREQLALFNNVMQESKDGLKFHPLAAGMLDDMADQFGSFGADVAWQEQVQKLQESRDIDPKVPSTFKATLRDYQLEGFRWLSQLAHWGVGACLADDMGLGKTIQGLAVLLDRAQEGPAMVVAPASVTRNWIKEAHKFAPTLRPILFGAGNRKKMVKNLGPFDMLVVSYGLLPLEAELLTGKEFGTIILDEAQAIKNRATKRSKTAMDLQGKFKVATTGTPIENHLGELWNLFNFLNPGLLGSLERFNNTYANPIEKNRDKEKSQQLRRLIQPFILRRRKSEVLTELPAKTEVTLTIELSDAERAFYEALRRDAVEKIAKIQDKSGQQRFQILAELMKLRQAANHPRLVDAKSQLPSSKLAVFAETVEELVENGHKALVFSQFTSHLRIVEEWVQSKGIPYQYLDGSTPQKKRQRAIDAFQSGDGEIFLISLKAGGTGLNLTAADYVLHLDPWWNPAVEDQASDRAHRMGQQRPVTIYRLVTENTIEEKIVKLHAEKRDLADSLLEGTEASAKLNSDDLLALIRG